MILSFVSTYIQASVISLVFYFQDMGGPNPVVVSDEDQVDKESVAAVADDKELDAGAEGEVANKETSNDLVGGTQDKEEETVSRTRSSSKVDPPTTPPLRRGRGRGRGRGRSRPKAATSTVDTPIVKTPQEAAVIQRTLQHGRLPEYVLGDRISLLHLHLRAQKVPFPVSPDARHGPRSDHHQQ